ncbi:MAG: 16S rRNA (cytidine(1402)-2'-O)-methyltransferase [Anaerolineales bacterium]|nr:16S rRNA (cytidine(1402)-2'-O)-methyltransferase [Anaerolineales bacterium]
MGTLYLVATPIGNLEDMSPRGVRILREVALIAAEDTRQTRKLLSHFDIHTPITSYFEHNKLTKLDAILETLKTGDVALVSDAGMPGINDPGYELVQAVLAAGHAITTIPGPSAPLAALVASGLPTKTFLYLGYLPRRTKERRAFLQELVKLPYTLIFLEAPHRLLASLRDLLDVLGNRPIAVAREMTKVHEEIWRGEIAGAHEHFSQNPPRGEFTLVVGGYTEPSVHRWSKEHVQIALKFGLKLGESPSALAKRLAEESGWNRKELYDLITGLKEK